MVTSRPGDHYISKDIKRRMGGLVNTVGFSTTNVEKCSELYLGKADSQKLLDDTKDIGLYDLLEVPIILLMACVVYKEQKTLPESETELFRTIFQLTMDRTTVRTMGCKTGEIPNLDDLLVTMGLFSWKALQNIVPLNRVCLLIHSEAQMKILNPAILVKSESEQMFVGI